MKPYYERGGITIYCGDCREIMPSLSVTDTMLTDPPYGISRHISGHKVVVRLGAITGDDKPFDPTPVLPFANRHILWGANHYANRLPNESAWLMWLKHDPSLFGLRSTSPFELAWTDLGGASRAFKFIWDGSIKQGSRARTEHNHPTEKPPELMKWCLSLARPEAVIDPYMGIGSTLLACKELNIPCVGIDIEERWCEIAAQRLSQEVLDFKAGYVKAIKLVEEK